MVQVDPIQSYLNLKIGLPPVLKAGSSGIYVFKKLPWSWGFTCGCVVGFLTRFELCGWWDCCCCGVVCCLRDGVLFERES